MIQKELKITNKNGDSIEFGRHYRLIEGLDFSALTANVSYSESTRDGGIYQNTILDIREFDLSFFIYNDYQGYEFVEERRLELFKVFNPKMNPFRVEFTTKGGKSYYINANLTAIPSLPQGLDSDNRVWQKGLLQFSSGDPFLYAAGEDGNKTVEIASLIKNFEFPLEILPEGIELGYREPNLIANVFNEGNETGILIRFRANAQVSNPSLVNVNTYQKFELNINMIRGDIIEVSTYTGRKSVTLIRNNVRTNIFNSVTLDSTFLKLQSGDNLFRYDASENIEFLEVSMNFTPTLVGV